MYLGVPDIATFEKMTIEEYELRAKAHRLRETKKERDIHWQAWLNRQVQAMEEVGSKQRYVFKTFKEFYDYEKALNEINTKELDIEKSRLIKIARMANERG